MCIMYLSIVYNVCIYYKINYVICRKTVISLEQVYVCWRWGGVVLGEYVSMCVSVYAWVCVFTASQGHPYSCWSSLSLIMAVSSFVPVCLTVCVQKLHMNWGSSTKQCAQSNVALCEHLCMMLYFHTFVFAFIFTPNDIAEASRSFRECGAKLNFSQEQCWKQHLNIKKC